MDTSRCPGCILRPRAKVFTAEIIGLDYARCLKWQIPALILLTVRTCLSWASHGDNDKYCFLLFKACIYVIATLCFALTRLSPRCIH